MIRTAFGGIVIVVAVVVECRLGIEAAALVNVDQIVAHPSPKAE